MRHADIVVAAAGVPGIITADMVKPGAAVLDVGVSRVDGKVAGDVAPDVWDVAGWVSPNPGGVGPMTRAMLLSNIVEIAEKSVRALSVTDPDPDRAEAPDPEIAPPESVPRSRPRTSSTASCPPVSDEERRYPSTIGGAFYLLVLAVVAVALVVVALDEWRSGDPADGRGADLRRRRCGWCCAARDAGMLAVRHKVLDAAILARARRALIFLAGSIPDQPDV